MLVKFITLKWGTKYGPEYVNRLYNNIKQTYSGEFEFHCFTDNDNDINSNIIIHDINTLPHFNSNVFTIVKIDLFKHLTFEGPYAFLDLDVLVINDLKLYFDSYNFIEPRYLYNYWSPIERSLDSFHRGDCFINSSFLTWDKDQFEWIYDLYVDNEQLINYKFNSFDKFVYYLGLDKLKFHDKNVAYTYSFGASYPEDLEPYQLRENYSIVLFNTSHKRGIELHDADGWARDVWITGRLPSR
jgi:hypothetical protein